MKKFLILTTVMVASFWISESFAGTILEPYVGANFNTTYKVNETGGDKGTVGGSAVGVRLGISQMGFMAGIDGRRMFYSFKPDSSTSDDTDYTFNQLGFFIGYEAPIMLRFWGEYVFSSEGYETDDSDNKLTDGSGYIIGVGYSVLPFVSLNLEMTNVSTAKFKSSSGEQDYDVNYTGYLIGVSLPLHL